MDPKKGVRGSIVVEAALVLPCFLSFIMLLIAFVQITLTEMAVQSAVSETVKVTAANMYPMELLYRQSKGQFAQSQAGTWLNQAVSQARTVLQAPKTVEAFVQEYARWLPEPVVQLAAWEAQKREALEKLGSQAGSEAKRRAEEALYPVLQPILAKFVNPRRLDKSRLSITDIQFPSFENREEAFFGLEVQYEMDLAVPFFRKTIVIKKRALERAWTGGAA